MAVGELSVFFPAYNEQAAIARTLERALATLAALRLPYEVLVVDDGSRDQTAEIVRALMDRCPHLRLIRHDCNRGYGAALASGLYAARFEWVCFMDADGQFDFRELFDFLAAQERTGADLVIGYYRTRQVSWVRRAGTWVWQLAGRLLFGLRVRNVDCGFKLVHRRVLHSIARLNAQRGAFVSTELLVKATQEGFDIVEIPVTHFERTAGAATGAELAVVISSCRDLFLMRRKLRVRHGASRTRQRV